MGIGQDSKKALSSGGKGNELLEKWRKLRKQRIGRTGGEFWNHIIKTPSKNIFHLFCDFVSV
jgi:hypothetical protein